MKDQAIPEDLAHRLEAELQSLRLELAGAELALSMVGRAVASATPQIAASLVQAMETVEPPFWETPCVQALLDGLENTRQRPRSQPRPRRLRLVVDNDLSA